MSRARSRAPCREHAARHERLRATGTGPGSGGVRSPVHADDARRRRGRRRHPGERRGECRGRAGLPGGDRHPRPRSAGGLAAGILTDATARRSRPMPPPSAPAPTAPRRRAVAESVPVRIGEQVVGIVVAGVAGAAGARGTSTDRRAWLEAAAAGRLGDCADPRGPRSRFGRGARRRARGGTPGRPRARWRRARRLGVDLSIGAVALSARGAWPYDGPPAHGHAVLAAELRPGRLVAVGPATPDEPPGGASWATWPRHCARTA